MSRRPLVLAVAALAGSLLALACNPLDPLRVMDDPQPIDSLAVNPDSASIVQGDTVRYVLSVLGHAGTPIVGRPVTWSVGNPAVASVDDAGLVTALAVGRSQIHATVDRYRISAELVVTAVPPPDPPPAAP